MTLNQMPAPLAAIGYQRGFDIDRLLADVVISLARRSVRLGGLLQVSTGARGGGAASVEAVDIRTGRRFDIWVDRGSAAKGCRLNETTLIDAEASAMAAIEDRVDLLILNRFGRAESLGRGLLRCFAEAVEAGIPVLTSVREPYESAWRDFHGGMGVELPANCSAAVDWGSQWLQRSSEGQRNAVAEAPERAETR